MPERRFGTRPAVLIDGNRLPSQHEPSLVTLCVETDLNAPGTCTMVFSDPDRTLLDDLGVEFLQTLEVKASAVEEDEHQQVFVGDVYGVELEVDELGCHAIIRGYDCSYRLRQHRAITSWQDVTDSDVIRSVAEDAGVEVGEIDAGTTIHPYLAQMNETSWDFIVRRARHADRMVFVREGKLQVVPAPAAEDAPDPGDFASRDPLQLTAGHNLTYLRVGATAAQQVGEVEARGWDPGQAEEVVGTSTAEAKGAQTQVRPSSVGNDHGTGRRIVGAPTLRTQGEVERLAESVGEMVAASYSFMEGSGPGDPRLQAGVAVSVGRAGRFDGRYTITSARHTFDKDGYHTDLRVSGEHDRSLYGLTGASAEQRAGGVVPAVVTDVQDPDSLGRVRVRFPWLADDLESDWARVSQVGAGQERGILWFPEVGDEVLVGFIDGSTSHPVVVGGLFNGVSTAPENGFDDLGDGSVDTRCLKTTAGHLLLFQDKSGEEVIRLVTADGNHSVALDQANSKIVIESSGDVTLNSTGKVEMKNGGSFDLDASGNATIKAGGNLKIEAGGTVEVTGALIKLN